MHLDIFFNFFVSVPEPNLFLAPLDFSVDPYPEYDEEEFLPFDKRSSICLKL